MGLDSHNRRGLPPLSKSNECWWPRNSGNHIQDAELTRVAKPLINVSFLNHYAKNYSHINRLKNHQKR
jgi:hypothetical protein